MYLATTGETMNLDYTEDYYTDIEDIIEYLEGIYQKETRTLMINNLGQ